MKTKQQLWVSLGRYPQGKNGEERPIEWLILKKEGSRMLLLSVYGLEAKAYNQPIPFSQVRNRDYKPLTWESSTLRRWLNETFYEAAFTDAEKSVIEEVVLQDDGFAECGTNGVAAPKDRLFLLSQGEAEVYFDFDVNRKCAPTEYIESRAVCFRWWLRSPSTDCGGNGAVYVDGDGAIDDSGYCVSNENTAVRPAVWVDLNAPGASALKLNLRIPEDDSTGKTVPLGKG